MLIQVVSLWAFAHTQGHIKNKNNYKKKKQTKLKATDRLCLVTLRLN